MRHCMVPACQDLWASHRWNHNLLQFMQLTRNQWSVERTHQSLTMPRFKSAFKAPKRLFFCQHPVRVEILIIHQPESRWFTSLNQGFQDSPYKPPVRSDEVIVMAHIAVIESTFSPVGHMAWSVFQRCWKMLKQSSISLHNKWLIENCIYSM